MVTKSICIACHSAISSNSGRHVNALASQLIKMGHCITVCVPKRESESQCLDVSYSLMTMEEYLSLEQSSKPDLIYCWTPRNLLIDFYEKVCISYKGSIPYVVHLEDNEALVLRDQARMTEDYFVRLANGEEIFDVPAHLSHPKRATEFLLSAAAVTALTQSLLELIPDCIPCATFWPGYDDDFEVNGHLDSLILRSRLNLAKDIYLISYTGNVHPSNLEEVRSLYIAVALVNRAGLPVKLIRTGLDYVPHFAEHGVDLLMENVISLGIVDKSELPTILRSADILVQPGRADDWNRYRVPSKLPEFFASGRPVLLPKINLGEVVEHGVNALVVAEGTAENIANCLIQWLPLKAERDMIGIRGRNFARKHLTWELAAIKVDELLRTI